MEIEGKLVQKMAIQSGQSPRGEWAKQEFVLEYQDGNFPAKACFSVWGQDKVKDFERHQIGDQVKVSFNISSREYNGRWYTDLRAWRVADMSQSPTQPAAQGSAPTGSNQPQEMPAGFAPSHSQQSQAAPPQSMDDVPARGEEDDLPF